MSDKIIDYETGEIVQQDDAYRRHRRIVDLRNRTVRTFLELGKELYWFEKEKQYNELGYTSFNAYLADPDVDIARRTAYRIKGVYETFVLQLGGASEALIEAGDNKLELIRPYVTPENVDEWVNKASSLSRSDLQKEVKEIFNNGKHDPGDLPPGTYNVIYADPPWQYDNSGFDQSAEAHYPTMTVEEICDLPVEDIAAFPCVLFLWATSPLLPDALKVIEAWGFEYKASRVWIKDRAPGIGWWVRTRHELLLIATKNGNAHPIEKLDSVINGEVTRHSKKPGSVYLDIETSYLGPKVELFARNKREGWEVWGNEPELYT